MRLSTATATAVVDRDQLLVELRPLVVRTVRLTVGAGSVVAEDAAQEALVELARSLPRLRDRRAARAFAARVAMRVALRTARRERRFAFLGLRESESDSLGSQAPELIDLKRAFDRLPARQRATAVLRLYVGLTEEETAEALQCSVGTVKSQLHDARRALAAYLAAGPTANRKARWNVNQDRLSEMLDAFAGPESPASQPRRGRHATRRTFVLVTAAVAALGLAVPGSLALLGAPQTPKQFFSDAKQPANAKKVISQMLELRGFQRGKLVSITNVIDTQTPAGRMYVYTLRFKHGYLGTAVISARKGGSGSIAIGSAGNDGACPRGWALRAEGGESDVPGQTYSFAVGRVSSKVASVHVLYGNGTTTPSAVGGGYYLAWIRPRAAYSNVTLVAENDLGVKVDSVRIGGNGIPKDRQGCG